jgi:hypothetical protein
MTQSRLARWAIAFFLVLVYAGGTYAFTASGSPGSPDANLACAPANVARFAPDTDTTTTTTTTDTELTTTTSTTTSTVTQPTTTTTTTTFTTTSLQPTTTTLTTALTKTATAAPTTATSTTTELQPTTTTSTTTELQPTTTTSTTTELQPTTTTSTATTTSPVTTTKTTTSPVTETQNLFRTVTATATCTATKIVPRPSRPTIVRFRLLHGTVPSGAPVVALFYAYPLGAKALVSISRGNHRVAVVRFVLRHEPTKLTIPAKKVKTPGSYAITIVVSSGSGRPSAARLHLTVLAPPTTKRSDRHRRS